MANNPLTQEYPWYATVSGDELEQGDILENCPVFFPPDELAIASAEPESPIRFRHEVTDVIVMSQSCDLVKGREKLDYVLLCEVWPIADLINIPPFSDRRNIEHARRGWLPGFHMLAKCELGDHCHDIRLVDFRRLHSLPLTFVRARATAASRLRLLPPYREHLSQAFARSFMRVGLPTDIPSF